MKRIFQFITISFAMLGGLSMLPANAQTSISVLTATADVRSAAMGTVPLVGSTLMPLYSTPSAMFDLEGKSLQASYAMGLSPEKSHSGRQYFHTLSAGYRLSSKHSLLIGARHWGGLQMDYFNSVGTKVGKIHPRDWTIDLGYAFALSPSLRLHAGASYLNTYSSQTAHGLMMHLGATYLGKLSFLNQGRYALDFVARNLGPKLSYGQRSKSSVALPTYLQASGMMSFATAEHQQLTFGLTARYQTTLTSDRAMSAGAGLEYDFERIVALRFGAVYQPESSYLTMGLGRNLGPLSLGASYSWGSYSEFNILNVGIALSF